MELAWRAINAVNDALTGFPGPVVTAILFALVVGMIVAWAAILHRNPRLALALNLAILVMVAREVLPVLLAPPPRGDEGGGVALMLIFWSGECLIAMFGVTGTIIALVRILDSRRASAEAPSLPRSWSRVRTSQRP